MNAEELRNLTESYYYDVYGGEELEEAQEVLSVKSSTGQQRMKQPRIVTRQKHILGRGPVSTEKITLSPTELQAAIRAENERTEHRRDPHGLEDEEKERAKKRAFDRQIHQQTRPANQETHLAHVRRKARARKGMDESYDLYDIVLDYLLSEGICETVHNAENIMANMSDAWISAILDEAASYEPTGRATRRPRQKGKKPEIPADIMARAQERAQQHQEYRTKHGITGLDVSPDAERIARTMMARKRAKETPQERLAKVQIRQ